MVASMSSSRPITILYDSECAMCRSQMRLIARLDWCHRLCLMPATDPQAMDLAVGLTRENLLEAIHCVTPNGRVYRGARCFRHLAMRLPLLVPLGLVLWFPGVIGVAEEVYHRVSQSRHAFSRWFGG
jgi:predicted DCC family thiol-disulfide oxidoreductase YuxK